MYKTVDPLQSKRSLRSLLQTVDIYTPLNAIITLTVHSGVKDPRALDSKCWFNLRRSPTAWWWRASKAVTRRGTDANDGHFEDADPTHGRKERGGEGLTDSPTPPSTYRTLIYLTDDILYERSVSADGLRRHLSAFHLQNKHVSDCFTMQKRWQQATHLPAAPHSLKMAVHLSIFFIFMLNIHILHKPFQ